MEKPVTAIEYYNPHVQIYLDGTADDGKTEKSQAAHPINRSLEDCENPYLRSNHDQGT